MANEVFDFLWSVPGDGYRWVEAHVPVGEGRAGKLVFNRPIETNKALVLTDGLTLGKSYMRKQYDPLQKYPGLFRTFADTPPTQESILGFANEYGSLGIEVSIGLPPDPRQGFFMGLRGEKFYDWFKYISAMRRAVSVW